MKNKIPVFPFLVILAGIVLFLIAGESLIFKFLAVVIIIMGIWRLIVRLENAYLDKYGLAKLHELMEGKGLHEVKDAFFCVWNTTRKDGTGHVIKYRFILPCDDHVDEFTSDNCYTTHIDKRFDLHQYLGYYLVYDTFEDKYLLFVK